MIDRPGRTVIICDGSVSAAVALAAAREARVQTGEQPAAVWIDAGLDADAPQRERAARSMAAAMGCPVIGPEQPVADPWASGADRAVMLLIAGTASCHAGRPEIVWPVTIEVAPNASPSQEAAAAAREIDRAVLVTRLLSLDAVEHDQVSARVSCPFAEMPDRGVAELAVDLSAPVERCWWVNQASVGAQRERARWESLLRGCGHPSMGPHLRPSTGG